MFSTFTNSKASNRVDRMSTGFIFGGYSGSDLNIIQRYDGTTRSTDGATLASSLRRMSYGTILLNSFIFGGWNGSNSVNTIQRYDGTTRSTDGATLAAGLQPGKTATISNICFIFGSIDAGSNYDIQRYDGTTRSTDGATLSKSGVGTGTYQNEAYLFGGVSGSTYYTSIQKYTGASLSSVATSLTTACSGGASATFYQAGAMVMIGGKTTNGNNTTKIYYYCPSYSYGSYSGEFINSVNLGGYRSAAFTFVGNYANPDKVYLTGGDDGSSTPRSNKIQSFTGNSAITTEAATLAGYTFEHGATAITTSTSFSYS